MCSGPNSLHGHPAPSKPLERKGEPAMTKDSTSKHSTNSSVKEEPSLMERLLRQMEEVNMPMAPDETPDEGPEQEPNPEDSPSQNTDEKLEDS